MLQSTTHAFDTRNKKEDARSKISRDAMSRVRWMTQQSPFYARITGTSISMDD